VSRWPLGVVLERAVGDEAAAREAVSVALAAQALRREERDAAAGALCAHGAVEAEATGRARRAGTNAASLRTAALHLARLRAEADRLSATLRARDAALAEARRRVELRRDALAAAGAAVRALEAHREGWRAARARARGRAEDAALDDLVTARRRPRR
jgi:chromosome segregation ATPase